MKKEFNVYLNDVFVTADSEEEAIELAILKLKHLLETKAQKEIIDFVQEN